MPNVPHFLCLLTCGNMQTNQKAAPCCPIMYRIGSNVVKISRITTSDEVTPTVKLTFWEIFPPDSGDIYLAFI